MQRSERERLVIERTCESAVRGWLRPDATFSLRRDGDGWLARIAAPGIVNQQIGISAEVADPVAALLDGLRPDLAPGVPPLNPPVPVPVPAPPPVVAESMPPV